MAYIQPSGAYGISAAQINTMVQEEPAALMSLNSTLGDTASALGMAADSSDGGYDTYTMNLGLFLGDTDSLGVSDDLSSLAEPEEKVNNSLLAAVYAYLVWIPGAILFLGLPGFLQYSDVK